MAALFEQTLILLVFIAVGFGLSKARIVHSEHAKILSELFVYIFLPCNCISTFSANFTVEYITEKYTLIISSAVLMIVTGVSMHFLAKLFSKNKYEQGLYEYSLVLSNCAGVGYSIALGVLGSEGLTDLMVFAIPINIYTYTYGYSMLTKRTISLKNIFTLKTLRMLLNPITLSMLVGMILGLTGISLPGFVSSALGSAAKCLTPAALLIVGIAISDFDLKKLFCDVRAYIAAAFRLVILPLVIGGVMWICGIRGSVLASAVIFLACPCGMNTVTIPKLFDENCEIGAGMALISNLFSCVTIPIILMLFGIGI
ncbi:MAG: AEC family transporter [Clostridia bacterium]|nr:AEC family transporter [Clostridia bacterium]